MPRSSGRPELFLNFWLPRTLYSVPCISFPVCSIHPYLHPHHPPMSCICCTPISCFFLYPLTQNLGTIVPLSLLPLFEMLCFPTFWNASLPITPTSVNYWTPTWSATSNFNALRRSTDKYIASTTQRKWQVLLATLPSGAPTKVLLFGVIWANRRSPSTVQK